MSRFDANNRSAITSAPHPRAAIAAGAKNSPAKARVMRHIGRLVADGFATWEMREDGEIEVRFTSGETYLLAETAILRLA